MNKIFRLPALAALFLTLYGSTAAQSATSNASHARSITAAVYSIGTGTVPGESGHFASLKAACDSLNGVSNWISTDITLYITSSLTEISNVALGPNTNGHTVTFKPYIGTTPTITFTQIADNGGLSGAWVIGVRTTTTGSATNYGVTPSDSTEHIIIDGSNTVGGTSRDLSIVTLSSSHFNTTPLVIFGNSNYIAVKNVVITAGQQASAQTTSGSYAIRITPRFATVNYIPDNITIDNCDISNTAFFGAQGIAISNSGTPTQFPTGIVISNNTITAATRGIFLNYSGNTDIYGNQISIQQSTTGYLSEGIFAYTIGSAANVTNIFKNKIVQLATANLSGGTGAGIYGIYIQSRGVYNVSNNVVTGFSLPNGFQGIAAGIGAAVTTIDGFTANIYHNSVLMNNGANSAGTTTPPIETAFYLNVSSTSGTRIVNVKNNIFATAESDYATHAFYWSNTSYPTVQSAYNVLFTAGGSSKTGRYGATDAATLADWIAAAKIDSTSVSEDPQFISSNDLHIKADAEPTSSASNAGAPIPTVTTDIDGDLRSATKPDIGADEFTAFIIVREPIFTPTPSVVDFKTLIINQQKIDSVTVTNTGNDSLFITNVTSTDSVFTVTPTSARLDTGASAKFYVTYKPKVVGVKAALILFANNTKSGLDSVTAVGTCLPVPAPVISFSPSSLAFRNVVAKSAAKDSVTVKNVGTDSLFISLAATNDPAFTITPTAARLDIGASAKFYVTYTAASPAMKNGFALFISNTVKIGDTLRLSGVGLTPMTLAEARKDLNSDLIPDHSVTKDTLLVYGVINAPSMQPTQTSYYMQDSTAGINIYSPSLYASATFNEGDSVFVVGTVAAFRGLTEILPLSLDSLHFGLLRHNAKLQPAKRLTLRQFVTNAESYEGQLIEIDTLFKASGTWPASGANGSIYVTNLKKTDTTQMFIDLDTDIDGSTETAYPINVVGIVSQYSSGTSVYNNGYEIIPRRQTDIKHIIVDGVDGMADGLPRSFELMNNYPNPFNPSTQIKFALPQTAMAKLVVYDMLGREVRTLVNRQLNAGYFESTWDGSNNSGVRVASGMYLYRMEAGSFVETKKMMLLK